MTDKKMRECIAKALEEAAKGQTTDCGDTALKAMIECAAKLKLPLRFKIWDSKDKKWTYKSYKDFSSLDAFIKWVLENMGSINILDNTKKKPIKDLQPGDMVIYDLRSHGSSTYSGHVRIVIRVNEDGTVTVVEGHTGNAAVEQNTCTTEKLEGDWDGPYEGGGREWDWKKLIVNE